MAKAKPAPGFISPSILVVLYGGNSVSLHLVPADKPTATSARTQVLRFARDGALGKDDPAVQFCRTLATAHETTHALRRLLERAEISRCFNIDAEPSDRKAKREGYRAINKVDGL